VLTSIDDEPKLVGEAVNSAEGKLWKDAMVEEMESFHKNETWDLVKLPSGRNFSPVAKLTSIRVLMSLAATFDLEIEQMDVKTMFLHGDLEE
jgi:hypothetical protein